MFILSIGGAKFAFSSAHDAVDVIATLGSHQQLGVLYAGDKRLWFNATPSLELTQVDIDMQAVLPDYEAAKQAQVEADKRG